MPKPRTPWSLRLSDEDVRLIERAAKRAHLAPRSWARAALLKDAERELQAQATKKHNAPVFAAFASSAPPILQPGSTVLVSGMTDKAQDGTYKVTSRRPTASGETLTLCRANVPGEPPIVPGSRPSRRNSGRKAEAK